MQTGRGISEPYRRRVDNLHRRFQGPFSVVQAAEALQLDRSKARRMLAHLATQGWLSRIRRDAHAPVPPGAERPSEWREDPWVVAACAFAPCYLAGWTACEHWGLTEQLFRDVQVVSRRRLRHREPSIQGTRFLIKVVAGDRFFGTRTAWRGPSQVEISDPSRTVVDLLDDPAMGGGARQLAEILVAYFDSEHRNDSVLAEYVQRMRNRTIWKRLGYLLETLPIDAPDLVASACHNLSKGISLLDPGAKHKGPIVKRWNLRVNVVIRRENH